MNGEPSGRLILWKQIFPSIDVHRVVRDCRSLIRVSGVHGCFRAAASDMVKLFSPCSVIWSLSAKSILDTVQNSVASSHSNQSKSMNDPFTCSGTGRCLRLIWKYTRKLARAYLSFETNCISNFAHRVFW